MPRIRTIKPQIWEDEKIAELSPRARLMFIGSFNFADDEGILIWRPEYLRSRIFPYDQYLLEEIIGCQKELEKLNFVFAYKRGGESYGAILNFRKHQVINRPQPSTLPSPSLEYNKKYRVAILKRDKYTCQYCGIRFQKVSLRGLIEEDTGLKFAATIDHIIPMSQGGTDYPSNLRACCTPCNSHKGTRPANEIIKENKDTPTPIIVDSLNNHGVINAGRRSKEEGIRNIEREEGKEGDVEEGFNITRRAYEENIGLLVPIVGEDIKNILQLLPYQWIVDVLEEAARCSNKPSWKYARRILERWAVEGRESKDRPKLGRDDKNKYTKGRYGVCPQCHMRPCCCEEYGKEET